MWKQKALSLQNDMTVLKSLYGQDNYSVVRGQKIRKVAEIGTALKSPALWLLHYNHKPTD
jgi:hypothetical protein